MPLTGMSVRTKIGAHGVAGLAGAAQLASVSSLSRAL